MAVTSRLSRLVPLARLRGPGRCERWCAGDTGAAVAEFAMITVLLVFLLFAVVQVAMVFYVRNIVAASAADGARYAASSNVTANFGAGAGADRASAEVGRALSHSVAQSVPCTGSEAIDPASGLQTAVVHCVGNIRSVFLPLAALVHIDVTARALAEPTS